MKSHVRILAIATIFIHLISFLIPGDIAPAAHLKSPIISRRIQVYDATDFLGVHLCLLLQSEELSFDAFSIPNELRENTFTLRESILEDHKIFFQSASCKVEDKSALIVFILTHFSLACFQQLVSSTADHSNLRIIYSSHKQATHFASLNGGEFLRVPLVYGPWSNLDNPVLGKLRNHDMRWQDMNAVFVIDAILAILRFIHGENPPINAPMIKTQHFNTIKSLQPKATLKLNSPLGELMQVREWWEHYEKTRKNKVSKDIKQMKIHSKSGGAPSVIGKRHEPFKGKRNLLMTCYITERVDPQRDADFVKRDEKKYLVRFYNSMRYLDLEHLDAVIFNDGLSDEFKSQYPSIKFETFEWDDYADKYHLSVNDQRYLLYLRYIQKHDGEYDFVLVTDLHDVSFAKDPFEYMRSNIEFNLFSGSESRKSEWSGWCQQRIRVCYLDTQDRVKRFWADPDVQPFNAGVFGGNVEDVILSLDMIKNEFESLPIQKVVNCNYGVYNFVLHTLATEKGKKIKAGDPWHSPFKERFQIKDKRFYVYHK